MHGFALGLAFILALAIIAIGVQYVARPLAMSRSFGLPLPGDGGNIPSWLRLKGVRDIASGLAVLAFLISGAPVAVGLLLLVQAVIPVGDMLVVLAGKGSARTALGVHGITAAVMVMASIPLIVGAR
jgi:hypothetical protein